MSATALKVTNNHFTRSHGRRPRGRGSWAFQASRGQAAFEHELEGDVVFFSGTFTEAVRALRESGATGLWAVLA